MTTLADRLRAAIDAAKREAQAALDAAGDDWLARGRPAGELQLVDRYEGILNRHSDNPALVREIAEKYGVDTRSPQLVAFTVHLDEHHCADEKHPDFMGGFGNCAEAMRLFNLMPDDERVLIG